MFGIPFRQKVILLTVVVLGVIIAGLYASRLLAMESLNVIVFLYGLLTPGILVGSDLLIDLNDRNVFKCWIGVGLVFLLCFLFLRDTQALILRPIRSDDTKYYRWIGNSAAEVLKCLPLFLAAYWILNYLSKKARGMSLVSTYKLNKWYSDAGKRKVDWVDVVINILLYLIILIGSIVKI